MQPSDHLTVALNKINAEINNRLSTLQALNEKRIALEGELTGLREAQHQFQCAQKKGEKD
jgi:hypothetical protein